MALPDPYDRLVRVLTMHRENSLHSMRNRSVFAPDRLDEAHLATDLICRVERARDSRITREAGAELLDLLDQVVEATPYTSAKADLRETLQQARDWWKAVCFEQNTLAVHLNKTLRARLDEIVEFDGQMGVWFHLNQFYTTVFTTGATCSASSLYSTLLDMYEQASHPLHARLVGEADQQDFMTAWKILENEYKAWRYTQQVLAEL